VKTPYQQAAMITDSYLDHKLGHSYGEEEMLDNTVLKSILDKFAPGVDVAGDGVYGIKWLSTTTFYRHTEEYVMVEQRLAYKFALEQAFPGKKGVM